MIMMSLKDTISNVISTMCFMFEESVNTEPAIDCEYIVRAEDDFFDIELLCSKKLAEELTTNFLGMDEKPSEEEILDSIKEIVNTIIGQFVSGHFEDHPQLLPIPEASICSEIPFEVNKYDHICLLYSQQPIHVYFKEKK